MKYVIVGGMHNSKKRKFELQFDWIIQNPRWPGSRPNSLLSDIENALIFDDAQKARDYAKDFDPGSSIKYQVFTVENVVLHQVMDC